MEREQEFADLPAGWPPGFHQQFLEREDRVTGPFLIAAQQFQTCMDFAVLLRRRAILVQAILAQAIFSRTLHCFCVWCAQQPSLAAEWCSRLGSARGFATRSMAPSVARTPSPFSEMASRTIQQRGQTGSGVPTKLGESSKERQTSLSHNSARSAGLRPFVDANIKKSEAGDRVQKLQQALNILGDSKVRSGWVARSIEARRDSSPGRARRQAGEGLRGVLVQGASTSGGTRTEAVCSRSQHQCCKAEVGNSEDATRLRATPTGHHCRGAKIAGFGESLASTSAWRKSRHALWTRCQKAVSFGTGTCSWGCHPCRVERVVGGAPCRSPRCVGQRRQWSGLGTHFIVVRRSRAFGRVDRGHVSMRTSARYGLRGSRVGEASNPGPPLTRLRRMGRPLDPVEVNSSFFRVGVPGVWHAQSDCVKPSMGGHEARR